MNRRLLNLLAGLSLLLCVAVCVLWVRSYWQGTRLHLTYGGETPAGAGYTRWTLESQSGRAVVNRWTLTGRLAPTDKRLTRWRGWAQQPVRLEPGPPLPAEGRTASYVMESLADFASDTTGGPVTPAGSIMASYVLVPHWVPLVPLAVPGLWWAWGRVAARRRRRGVCPSCGYDLRASPGRCPECGRLASVSPTG